MMAEQKHTPGPWTAGESTGGIWHGKKFVASVYGDRDDCHPDDRMIANARLIAAAPELLEALEIFVAVRGNGPAMTALEYDSAMARAQKHAETAIAKATP